MPACDFCEERPAKFHVIVCRIGKPDQRDAVQLCELCMRDVELGDDARVFDGRSHERPSAG